LEQLDITLFNQIAFALPHLYHLINSTERFKLPKAAVFFNGYDVEVTMADYAMRGGLTRLYVCV
jgi:hypothetical protein